MANDELAQIEQHHWKAIEQLHDESNEKTWHHVGKLQKIGSESILKQALDWCASDDAFRRSIGVSVLAQLGFEANLFHGQVTEAISRLVRVERDSDVITSLISAVRFRSMADAYPWLIQLADHPCDDVRWRVAWALPSSTDVTSPHYEESIEALIKLSTDCEPLVRDWATFTLGSIVAEDNQRTRDVLLARIDDEDFNVRSEAFMGLAQRGDIRCLDRLVAELDSDHVGELFVEAAFLFARPQLLPSLRRLQEWWDVDPQLLARAIAACS